MEWATVKDIAVAVSAIGLLFVVIYVFLWLCQMIVELWYDTGRYIWDGSGVSWSKFFAFSLAWIPLGLLSIVILCLLAAYLSSKLQSLTR